MIYLDDCQLCRGWLDDDDAMAAATASAVLQLLKHDTLAYRLVSSVSQLLSLYYSVVFFCTHSGFRLHTNKVFQRSVACCLPGLYSVA